MNKLYKRDTKGKIRVWCPEIQGDSYRIHSGTLDGKIVTSQWKTVTGKNIGKSNETTPTEQVLLEVQSEYDKKLSQGGYFDSLDKIDESLDFIEPMLAQKFDPKKHKNYPYIVNPKLDGIRCIATKDGLKTRNGKPIIAVPHIEAALVAFFDEHPSIILDGELYNHDLKHDFEKIVSVVRKSKPNGEDIELAASIIQYHVYDCILPHHKEWGYSHRFCFLKHNLNTQSPIYLIEASKQNNFEDIEQSFREFTEKGYEGAMVRDMDMPYEHKRSKGLLKFKEFFDDEFEIVDIIEGIGNWGGYAKSIAVKLPNGETQQAGMRGNFEFAKNLLNNKEKYIGTEVTIRYQNLTGDGLMRFPIAIKFWGDKRKAIE